MYPMSEMDSFLTVAVKTGGKLNVYHPEVFEV